MWVLSGQCSSTRRGFGGWGSRDVSVEHLWRSLPAPPVHRVSFAQRRLPDAPARLPASTTSLARMAVGNLSSTRAEPWHTRHPCGAGLCPPWGIWTWELVGTEAGRVCLHVWG